MFRFLPIVLLCLIPSITVSAIDILRINHLTDRNGLSQNTVRCMLEDSRGFMWMGTINGLNRYNGREFIVVQPPENSDITLSDTRIRQMVEDRNGYIWIRTFSNTILCYDLRTEAFVSYNSQNDSKVFSNILIASNGDIWLWGTEEFCRIRHTSNGLTSWSSVHHDLRNQHIWFVYEDSYKKMWIGTNNGLFNIVNNTVTPVFKDQSFFRTHEYGQYQFFLSDSKIVVFDGLNSSFLSDIHFEKGTTLQPSRSCLLNSGVILIAKKEDLYAFDAKSMKFIPSSTFFKGSKPKNASFIADNKGQIWLYNMSGTLWRG